MAADSSLWARVHNHIHALVAQAEVPLVYLEAGVAAAENETITAESVVVAEVSQSWSEGRDRTSGRSRDLSDWTWTVTANFRARIDTHALALLLAKRVSELEEAPTIHPQLVGLDVESDGPDAESHGHQVGLTFEVLVHPA